MENNTKFCQHCGAQIDAQAVVCVSCGRSVAPVANTEDKPSRGLNILAFLFPIIGLILYLVNMNSAPVKAKAIGKWALIGFVVGIVFSILSTVITSCAAAMMYY